MTTQEITNNYYYEHSFEFQDTLIQLWIHKTKDEVCFYEKSTGVIVPFDEKEVHAIKNILHTVENSFFKRRISKEKTINDY